MSYIAIGLTFVSIIFFIKSNFKNNLIKISTLVFIYMNLIFLGFFYFFNFLSGDGLNEAVIFHIVHGITGFGIDEYIFPGVLLISFISFSIFLVQRLSSQIKYKTSKLNSLNIPIMFGALLSLIVNPL